MAVAYLPPHTANEVQNIRSFYDLEGESSHELAKEFESAVSHWQLRQSDLVNLEEDPDNVIHVPFKKVGTIKVRFKPPRPMTPRVIEIEELESE